MRTILTLLLLLWGGLLGFSQNEVQGIILDEETHQPIEGVNIFSLKDQNTGTISNKKGQFNLSLPMEQDTIVFSFLGYRTQFLSLSQASLNVDTIFLKADIFQLPDIEVSAKMDIQAITTDEESILDFILWEDYILYIRYIGSKKDLVLANLEGKRLFSRSLDLRGIEKLHRSCLGNPHLITDAQGIELHIDQDTFLLGHVYPRQYYDLYLEPCVAGLQDEIILKYTKDLGLRTTFIKARKDATNSEVIFRIQDDDKLRSYYEKYNLLHAADNNTIALLEVAHADFKRAQRIEFEREFYRKIFLKGIDIPLVKMQDSLAILNFIHGELIFTDYSGEWSSSLPIDFHLNKKWDKKVILDEGQQRLFTTFREGVGRFIVEIDLHTGKCKAPIHLESKLVKKIAIHNGQMYLLQSDAHLPYWTLNKVQLR